MDFGAKEERTLLLMRSAVTGRIDEQMRAWDEAAWLGVLEELQIQTAAAVTAGIALECCSCASASQAFLEEFGRTVKKWHELMARQDEVLGLLREASIPVVVLKGAAAAANYPNPTLRCMGDIDLIVAPGDFDRALNLLLDAGFVRLYPDLYYQRHESLGKQGFPSVQLHRWFSLNQRGEENKAINNAIVAGISQAEVIDVAGFSVPVLAPLENGLVLIEHMRHHLLSGLGLRQVLDWLFFVENCMDDKLWCEFESLARECGLLEVTLAMTALCKRYLGLKRDVLWADSVDIDLVNELMQYVFSQGNMGRKVEAGSGKTKTVLKHFSSPISALRYLYTGGMVNWKAAGRYAVLRPLVPFYQIGHLAKMGFARKAAVSDLVEEAKFSRVEIDLLERLNALR